MLAILFAILLVIMIVLFLGREKITEKDLLNSEKKVDSFLEKLTNKDVKFSDYKAIVGSDKVVNVNLVLGDDSYLKNRPDNSIIEKNKLEYYVKKQDEYAKIVQNEYSSALKYEISENYIDIGKVCHHIKLKSFYYSLYLYDLIDLTNAISSASASAASVNSNAEIIFFKAQVTAMAVLNNHIDFYRNKTDEMSELFYCPSSDEITTLVTFMMGEMYANSDFSSDKVVRESNERIANYLKESKSISF